MVMSESQTIPNPVSAAYIPRNGARSGIGHHGDSHSIHFWNSRLMKTSIIRQFLIALIVMTGVVSLSAAPVITSQPSAPVVVSEGNSIDLKVQASGDGDLSYQWFKNDSMIDGATGPVLEFFPLARTDTGRFHVLVSDTSGSVKSSFVILRVAPGASFTIEEHPRDLNIQQGSAAIMKVVVSSNANLRYIWFKDGVPLPDSNTPQYALPAVQYADGGQYHVEVSDGISTVVSNSATLRVQAGILIIEDQLADQTIIKGRDVNVWVRLTSQEPLPLNYQWFKDGQKVAFATNPEFTIFGFNADDEGQYVLEISTIGILIKSDPINLKLNRDGIIITRNPASREVLLGGDVEFNVTAVSEKALLYQWYKNNEEIAGATSSKLLVQDVSAESAGDYHVVISNANTSTKSLPGKLVPVEGNLFVESHPSPSIALKGQTVTLTAKIIGSLTIKYQWLKDGIPLIGATSPSLTLNNVNALNSGKYALRGRASTSEVLSNAAQLAVRTPEITILQQPGDQIVIQGDSISLSIAASSPSSIAYQWFFNGTAIDGATSSSLVLSNAGESRAGEYHVVLQSAGIEITSDKAVIKVQQEKDLKVQLNIRQSQDAIDLVWPVTSSPSGIEFSSSIGSGAVWQSLEANASIEADQNVISIPLTDANLFFRVVSVAGE